MAILSIEDNTGKIDVTLFSDVLSESRDKMTKDQLVVVEGQVSKDNFSQGLRMTVKSINSLGEARAKYAKYLKIKLNLSHLSHFYINEIKNALRAFPYGQFPVQCVINHDCGQVHLKFGKSWGCMPEIQLIEQLERALGQKSVNIEY